MIGGICVEFNIFQSLLFGFVSGLTDILPVSAQAHKAILLTLFGSSSEPALLRLLLDGAVLAALYVSLRDPIRRIRKQVQLSKIPKRRRKRPLDVRVLMELRLVRTMAVVVVICGLFSQKASALNGSLIWIALLSVINALILFLPNLMPTGNKDSQSLSPMEGVLIGLGGGIGILPGISSMAGMNAVASVCGVERKFALRITLMAQMAVLAVRIVFDVIALSSGIGALTAGLVLRWILAALAAFAGVTTAVSVMAALAEKKGFTVFALYSMAVAFLTFIIYLMV